MSKFTLLVLAVLMACAMPAYADSTSNGITYFPLTDNHDKKNPFQGCFGYDSSGQLYKADFGKDNTSCTGTPKRSDIIGKADTNRAIDATNDKTGQKYHWDGMTLLKFGGGSKKNLWLGGNGKYYYAKSDGKTVHVVVETNAPHYKLRDEGNNQPISHEFGNNNPDVHPYRAIDQEFTIGANTKPAPPPPEPKKDPRLNPGVVVGPGDHKGDIPDVQPQTPPAPPVVDTPPKKSSDQPVDDEPQVRCELKKSVAATGDSKYCDILKGKDCNKHILRFSCRTSCDPKVCQDEIDKVDGKIQDAMKQVQDALANFRQALNDNSNDTTCLTIKGKVANKKNSDLEIYKEYVVERHVDGRYKSLVDQCNNNYERHSAPATHGAAGKGKPTGAIKRRTQSEGAAEIDPGAQVPENGSPDQVQE
jgi:hypothetical protein